MTFDFLSYFWYLDFIYARESEDGVCVAVDRDGLSWVFLDYYFAADDGLDSEDDLA